MSEERQESEFGRGVVTCLAKFSEHLFMSESFQRVYQVSRWVDGQVAVDPDGASMARYAESMLKVLGSKERVLSMQISYWMSGASDHFAGLDRERSPQCLRELAELTRSMGHGFMTSRRVWTMKDVDRIRDLWMQSCLALDKAHGVDAEWGRY